jgi:hypothetical protein
MKAWKNFVFDCSSLCSLLSWHEDEVDEMGDEMRTVCEPRVFTSYLRGLYADFKPATTCLSEQR